MADEINLVSPAAGAQGAGSRCEIDLLSLYEVSESCQTFKTMFVDNIKYAESFIRHFEADYGYDDHDTFFVGDGGATPKHAGTGGTTCICTY